MCCKERQGGCQKPENLTGKPEECSPEQIRKCHGAAAVHPCEEKRSNPKDERTTNA